MQKPDSGETKESKPIIVIKNTYDYQRMKLERLMKNPDKAVQIPNRIKDKSAVEPPDFVRNVMGSSAGAGSGEFHVYRHIRRREYARQKAIQVMSEKERKDEEYKQKIESNINAAKERTEKKRLKRLRKKTKPARGHAKKVDQASSSSENEELDPENEEANTVSTEKLKS